MEKLKPTVLQIDVSTNEQWNELLTRPGLILVDVYSSWSGPCVAMVSTLKKIKVELGGDLLNYAIAQNDDIDALERFRGRSEPVWMFLQNGKSVNLTFGSDCKNLKAILVQEIKRAGENEPPEWELRPEDPCPAEVDKFGDFDWRKQREKEKLARDEDEKRKRYEEYMEQMTIELSEETALIIFPWIFMDDHGHQKDKEQSPPYLELMYRVLPDRFDVLEQTRIQLTEDIVEKMFVESGVPLTDGLLMRFIEGESVAMRLKAKAPPADWPVPYPFIGSEGKRCPARAIDDAENFIRYVVQEAVSTRDDKRLSFVQRYSLVIENAENEDQDGDESSEVYPPVWFPSNARSKVHVFKTLFPGYMEKAHGYKPVKQAARFVFKFDISKLSIVRENCRMFPDAIDHFGIFESDDPNSARLASAPDTEAFDGQSYGQIIIIVMRKLNDAVFLSFAGNYPTYIEDNVIEVARIVEEYFPTVTDAEQEEKEEEEGEEEEEEENYREYEESLD